MFRDSPLGAARACAVTVGVSGIVAQTLLLRELLAQFAGNELYVGLIIGIWIAAEAGGALLAGRCTVIGRSPQALFLKLTLGFSLAFPLSILLTRSCKALAALPIDQAATLHQVVVTALVLLLPPAMLHGAQFVAATALFAAVDPAAAAGRVYALDTLGTIVGGMLVSFVLLPLLNPFQSGALLLLAGAGTALALRRVTASAAWRGGSSGITLCLLLLAPLLLAAGGELERFSLALQWQGRELLTSSNSPYQNIAVIRDQGQQTLYSDGRPLFSFPVADIEAVELLVHLPLLAHPEPRRVLLLGGGAGGLLAEILKYGSIQRVDYLEPDPALTAAVASFADAASRQALTDPRVRILHRDSREFVRRCSDRYDVILIGAPLPENLQANRYFTVEFYRRLATLLTARGVVAVLAPGSTAYYGPELQQLTASLLATFRAGFPYTLTIPGERNLFLASAGPELAAVTADSLAGRLAASGVQPLLLSREHLRWLFDPGQLAWFHGAIGSGGVVNRDLEPYLLARQISRTTATYTPALKPWLDSVDRLSTSAVLAVTLLLAAVCAVRCRYRPQAALPYLIATSGCSAMLLELVLMLLFQLVHGALVRTVGLLIALFMAGLWCGSMLTTRERAPRDDHIWLVCGEVGFMLLCATLALLFSVNGFTTALSPAAAYLLILPLLLLCGLLTGLQFPPAVRQLGRESTGGVNSRAAAIIYACDLAGGCLGGILGGLLFLPLLGFRTTLLFLLLLKAGSFIALQISGAGGRIKQ